MLGCWHVQKVPDLLARFTEFERREKRRLLYLSSQNRLSSGRSFSGISLDLFSFGVRLAEQQTAIHSQILGAAGFKDAEGT